MAARLRLLCIVAHPDDESLGLGGMLAKYAAEGVETYLVTGTRGQQGWFGPPEENPGPRKLGEIRERELRGAAKVLGLREVHLLDYQDGGLYAVDQTEIIPQVVEHVRRIRPDVVVTFDQHGIYGHPDHIVMCQVATAAVVAAADASYEHSGLEPHAVSKLYYRMWAKGEADGYEAAFGRLAMNIDGVERSSVHWPEWSITTWIDTSDVWERVWEAVTHHETQLTAYQSLHDLPEEHHRNIWGRQSYYRVFSTVNRKPGVEDDLFDGLREEAT